MTDWNLGKPIDDPEKVVEEVREWAPTGRPIADAMERILHTKQLHPGDSPMSQFVERRFVWGMYFGVALERSGFFEDLEE